MNVTQYDEEEPRILYKSVNITCEQTPPKMREKAFKYEIRMGF